MSNEYGNEVLIASVGLQEDEDEVRNLWMQMNPTDQCWSGPSFKPGDYDCRLVLRRPQPSGALLSSLRMRMVKTGPSSEFGSVIGPDQLVLMTLQICSFDTVARFALWYQALRVALFTRTNDEGFACDWHVGVFSTLSRDLDPDDRKRFEGMGYKLLDAENPTRTKVLVAMPRSGLYDAYDTRRNDDVREWLPHVEFRGKEPFQVTVPPLSVADDKKAPPRKRK